MRLSLCALLAASLLNGASAFFPYRLDDEAPTDHSALNHLERRLPRQLQDSQDGSSASRNPLTLPVRRAPVRRDSNYAVIKADKPSAPHSVPLDQDGHDYAYFATVKLGSENQEMWLMLDTGGTNTWVYGRDCQSKVCKAHRSFDEAASHSFSETNTPFDVTYDSGHVSGVLGKDTLSIAGLTVPMSFGLASKASDNLLSYPNDGIIGLSRSKHTEFGTRTFMDVVAEKNMLKSNIVAFRISRASDGAKDGEVTFGGVDKSKFSGDITYTNVVESSDKWTIPVDDAMVDGQPCNFVDKKAVIDTETSYALLPPADAEAINALIPGAAPSGSNFELPCDTTATLQFTFSGVSYNISPEDYVQTVSGGRCMSAIVGRQVFGANEWLVGDVFLKNVYSVFDYDNNRVGFANAADHATGSEKVATTPTSSAVSGPSATGATGGSGGTGATGTTGTDSTGKHHQSSKGNAGFLVTPSAWWPAIGILSILCS